MLTNIPAGIKKMARNVVLFHPNTCNVQVFRKVITRPDSAGGTREDGIRMLENDDEAQFDYQWIGNGYAMPAETFTPGSMSDHGDAVIGAQPVEMRFLLEPEEPEGEQEYFVPQRHDVFYVLLTGEDGAKLAYEIVDIESMSSIPPYAPRYVCNRRDDLHVEAG